MTSALRDFYEALPRTAIDARPEVAWAHGRVTGQRVLDIGCGDGSLTSCAVNGSGATTVGIDVSSSALTSARERGVTVVQAGFDGASLPFADASFDTVLLHQVIEHVTDTDGLIDEATRVLVPGGTLLLSTPNLAAWFNRVLLAAGVQPVFSEVSLRGVYGRPGREVAGHLRLFTHRALAAFLASHDLEAVTIAGATYHDVPRSLRWLDRLLVHSPRLAAQLLVEAKKRQPANVR